MSIVGVLNTDGPHSALKRIIHPFLENLDLSKGVFLKPNIVFPVRPSTREITDPLLVAALIGVLREIKPNVDIVIGEGPAAGTDPAKNFTVSGYERMARDLDVPLDDLHGSNRISVPWARGELHIPQDAMDRVHINLPILKVSSAATVSGAMKNLKGLLTPTMKKKFHRMDLHRPIAELALAIAPDLTIMDTSRFFSRSALLAGDNTFELDHFICDILAIPEPEYLRVSEELGVGRVGYDVVMHGDLEPCWGDWEPEEYKKILNLRLWSNPRACSMCRLSFHELKSLRVANTPQVMKILGKLLRCGVAGTDILFGSNPFYRDSGKRIICIGDCLEKLAGEKGYEHVPGCPPGSDEIYKKL